MGGGLDLFSATAEGPNDGAWSVSDVTKQARRLIESGFTQFWVRGEVTGFKAYRSGHWYFTLRDADAQVRCVMWRNANRSLPVPPREGSQVFIEATPTVWEERGEFRLTVKRLVPTDEGGLWQIRLEKARAALQRDGLLDPARKRPLPEFPSRIAVVTSPDGAALRDIVSVMSRRWPMVELLVVPSLVQGEGAEEGLCAGLELADRLPCVDLVIVGRGGGSAEDLWAFNSEKVARTLAAMSVPTISAVGHETDVALTDLVADLRAPTPSAAAEAAVPNRPEVVRLTSDLARRLASGLSSHTMLGRERLARTADRLTNAISAHVETRKTQLGRLSAQLDALSPLKVLERGYAVARDENGHVLKHTSDFKAGLEFCLTVSDGDVAARAIENLPDEGGA
ncbi:exodeoxyribonuclease VII large subunit [Gemmatimonadota bacterium]